MCVCVRVAVCVVCVKERVGEKYTMEECMRERERERAKEREVERDKDRVNEGEIGKVC